MKFHQGIEGTEIMQISKRGSGFLLNETIRVLERLYQRIKCFVIPITQSLCRRRTNVRVCILERIQKIRQEMFIMKHAQDANHILADQWFRIGYVWQQYWNDPFIQVLMKIKSNILCHVLGIA